MNERPEYAPSLPCEELGEGRGGPPDTRSARSPPLSPELPSPFGPCPSRRRRAGAASASVGFRRVRLLSPFFPRKSESRRNALGAPEGVRDPRAVRSSAGSAEHGGGGGGRAAPSGGAAALRPPGPDILGLCGAAAASELPMGRWAAPGSAGAGGQRASARDGRLLRSFSCAARSSQAGFFQPSAVPAPPDP